MNILERRLEVLKCEQIGYSRAETVIELSKKYDIPKSVLWYDYRNKRKWQPHIQGIDAEQLRLTIHNRFEYCYRKASFLLMTSQNENVQLGALSRMIEVLNAYSHLLGPQVEVGTEDKPFIIKYWRPENAIVTTKE